MFFLCLLLSPYVLWLFYLAVMSLDRAQQENKLTPAASLLAKPIIFVGYALDVFLNVTLFSLLILDVPRELTVTSHVNRLLRTPAGLFHPLSCWRLLVCKYLCAHLLNPFDPSGAHCVAKE